MPNAPNVLNPDLANLGFPEYSPSKSKSHNQTLPEPKSGGGMVCSSPQCKFAFFAPEKFVKMKENVNNALLLLYSLFHEQKFTNSCSTILAQQYLDS